MPCRTASVLEDISVHWERTTAAHVNQYFCHQFSSPVHCIYLWSTSEIDLLQLKLFVALYLEERLDFFLLNPDLTLMAVGQGKWTHHVGVVWQSC